jgi:hypothetical protein
MACGSSSSEPDCALVATSVSKAGSSKNRMHVLLCVLSSSDVPALLRQRVLQPSVPPRWHRAHSRRRSWNNMRAAASCACLDDRCCCLSALRYRAMPGVLCGHSLSRSWRPAPGSPVVASQLRPSSMTLHPSTGPGTPLPLNNLARLSRILHLTVTCAETAA